MTVNDAVYVFGGENVDTQTCQNTVYKYTMENYIVRCEKVGVINRRSDKMTHPLAVDPRPR